MALSGLGRELWPPGLSEVSSKSAYCFSVASTSTFTGLPFRSGYAAGIGVQRELGVDQIAMVLQQPIDAVGFAALLIGGQREDEIAVGHDSLRAGIG